MLLNLPHYIIWPLLIIQEGALTIKVGQGIAGYVAQTGTVPTPNSPPPPQSYENIYTYLGYELPYVAEECNGVLQSNEGLYKSINSYYIVKKF